MDADKHEFLRQSLRNKLSTMSRVRGPRGGTTTFVKTLSELRKAQADVAYEIEKNRTLFKAMGVKTIDQTMRKMIS